MMGSIIKPSAICVGLGFLVIVLLGLLFSPSDAPATYVEPAIEPEPPPVPEPDSPDPRLLSWVSEHQHWLLQLENCTDLSYQKHLLWWHRHAYHNAVRDWKPTTRALELPPYPMAIPLTSWRATCETLFKRVPDHSIDLIVTSPPYADSRNGTYGGMHPDTYVTWFLPKTAEFLRVLKPTGTFVLNIKEKVVDGERHTYVLELIQQMRAQGWRWTEESIWHKKNAYPGKWPNRFRDAWERCLQFNKAATFAMYQEAVMVSMGEWTQSRLRKLSETDKRRDISKVGSGFGKNIANWIGRDKAYPTNVLHLATECSNKNHPAAFPEALPEWFIRLFTQEGDIVLDPFLGSGTTAVVAKRLGRQYIGIDMQQEYCAMAEKSLADVIHTPYADPRLVKSY